MYCLAIAGFVWSGLALFAYIYVLFGIVWYCFVIDDLVLCVIVLFGQFMVVGLKLLLVVVVAFYT